MFPIEISLSPLKTSHGAFVVTAMQDVSERRHAEAERAHSIEAGRAQADLMQEAGRRSPRPARIAARARCRGASLSGTATC